MITTRITTTFAGWMARRAARRDLTRLDDRALEDIGFNRADVEMRFG